LRISCPRFFLELFNTADFRFPPPQEVFFGILLLISSISFCRCDPKCYSILLFPPHMDPDERFPSPPSCPPLLANGTNLFRTCTFFRFPFTLLSALFMLPSLSVAFRLKHVSVLAFLFFFFPPPHAGSWISPDRSLSRFPGFDFPPFRKGRGL